MKDRNTDTDKGCTCQDNCAWYSPGQKIPQRCPALGNKKALTHAIDEYRRPNSIANRLYGGFSKLVGSGGSKRSRIEHIMEFSRAVGFQRIGIAACAFYLPQIYYLRSILEDHGFSCMGLSCKIGGLTFADIGIPNDSNWILCNPLAQAFILNDFQTELNITVGLCMGHDLIFQSYSNAPVTNYTVKEKISDDNPVATLKKAIAGEYFFDPVMVD